MSSSLRSAASPAVIVAVPVAADAIATVAAGLTVESFGKLVEGELDHIPEQAFYNKGGIDDVQAAAKELGDS